MRQAFREKLRRPVGRSWAVFTGLLAVVGLPTVLASLQVWRDMVLTYVDGSVLGWCLFTFGVLGYVAYEVIDWRYRQEMASKEYVKEMLASYAQNPVDWLHAVSGDEAPTRMRGNSSTHPLPRLSR